MALVPGPDEPQDVPRLTFVTSHVRDLDEEPRGGLGRYELQLARAIVAEKHHLSLAGLAPMRVPGPVLKLAHRVGRHPESVAAYLPYRLTASARADVLLFSNQLLGSGILYRRLRDRTRGRRTPILVTVHDLCPLRELRRDRSALDDWDPTSRRLYRLHLWGCRLADQIITPSNAAARDVVDMLGVPPGRVSVVHHGFTAQPAGTEDDAPERLRASLGVEPDGFLVLYVGSQGAHKNLSVLIDAIVTLRREGLPVRLVIAGAPRTTSPASRNVQAAAPGDAVRFLGAVDERTLGLLYRAANAFALPSRCEGFGLPLLEAMAQGCPVIANNASSIPEVTGDAALLVSEESTESWARAIARLRDDSRMYQALVEAGRARAATFEWRSAGEATVRLAHRAWAGLASHG